MGNFYITLIDQNSATLNITESDNTFGMFTFSPSIS